MVKLLKAVIILVVIAEILFTIWSMMRWGVNNQANSQLFIKWLMSLGVSMIIGFIAYDRAYTLGLNYVK